MGIRALLFDNPELWWETQRLEKTVHGCWRGMWERCTNPTAASWKDYGGRGITVCDRWRSFYNFWSDMGDRPSLQHSIDRVDNNLGYTPENCCWATPTEQVLNSRLRSTNSSGVKGVCWSERLGWRATATVRGTQIHLYNGPSFEKAVAARQAWNQRNLRDVKSKLPSP